MASAGEFIGWLVWIDHPKAEAYAQTIINMVNRDRRYGPVLGVAAGRPPMKCRYGARHIQMEQVWRIMDRGDGETECRK